MLVYRIVHKKYSSALQPSGLAGRWNSSGKKIIYAAESIALAFLENMVRRQGVGFNADFKIMFIEIPDKIEISTVKIPDLEEGWRNIRDYSKCQSMGNKWNEEARTMILKVPSAVMPEEHNFLINSLSPDFRRVKLVATTSLIPDERIEQILKRYRKG